MRSSNPILKCIRCRPDGRRSHCERLLVSAVTIALIVLVIPIEANANVFGHCAHQKNLEVKIASCIEASRSTPYPWILQWVYREMARAQRERGEIQKALTSYARSLAAEEREWVRREMEELVMLTQ